MARRRKTRYQWLYNTGTIGPGANPEDTHNGREIILNPPQNGESDCSAVDLLLDTASDEQPTTLPMGVYQNNEYVIKRIVGKVWGVNTTSSAITGASRLHTLTCGLFVARAGDEDETVGAKDLPIGFTQGASNPSYNPNRAETIREPWIWRRQWIIQNDNIQNAGNFSGSFPSSTAGYGSVADGPHIDAKTGRRVAGDERLFFVAQARTYPPNATADGPSVIQVYIDYRVLGAMRRTRGRSAF